jgi:sodium/bile acid cotransporter 7
LLGSIKRNWFLLALAGLAAVTLMDGTDTVARAGKGLKLYRATDVAISLIFFLSGLILKKEQIRAGISDLKGTVLALCLIFVVAPFIAFVIASFPLDSGVKIGLFLVAVMPTTMSTGVVMTGAAGGNIAHSLLITVVANSMSIVTIPLALALLLGLGGGASSVPIEKGRLMLQMGMLVLAPLLIGLFLRPKSRPLPRFLQKGIPVFNQCLILTIVWMGLSGAKAAVLESGSEMVLILFLTFLFHALLLAASFAVVRVFRIEPGRRESVIFMGSQKTLPLAVMLQVTLFPQYGVALAFCVFHHFVHLMMDGYLVGRLNRGRRDL